MFFKEAVYKGMAVVLAVAIAIFSGGCSVQESPAPIETSLQPIDIENQTPMFEEAITPTTEQTPIVTPEPTPDLTFKTDADIDDPAKLEYNATMFVESLKSSNVIAEDEFNYNDPLFITQIKNMILIMNDRVPTTKMTDYDILSCISIYFDLTALPYVFAKQVLRGDMNVPEKVILPNFSYVIPKDSEALKFNEVFAKYIRVLATNPSKEKQNEVFQEMWNFALEYGILEGNTDELNKSKLSVPGELILVNYNIFKCVSITYDINKTIRPQYPSWHENHSEYMETQEFIDKILEFKDTQVDDMFNKLIEDNIKKQQDNMSMQTFTCSPILP